MKKRVLLIGRRNCGKTDLVNHLNGDKRSLLPTQVVTYRGEFIDVPGSYLETPDLFCHIIAVGQDARLVLMLIDQTEMGESYAPGFAQVFHVPVLGVITKGAFNRQNRKRCEEQLDRAGVWSPYYVVDTSTQCGIASLQQRLEQCPKER